ncbi:MAG: signal peptidase I [Coriobacteriia bacterium]|nr:signal peptidase I [Coriobacteriia bacterium]
MTESHEIYQQTDTTREQVAPGSCLIAPDEEIGPDDATSRTSDEVSFGRWVLELVVLVGVAFLLATGIKTWVVQPFIIPTGSMIPTLEIGDYVIANKFIYRFEEPHYGDIVVFLSPASNSTDYIKRVIAVGGQEVDVRDGLVYVDGQPLDEPYTHGAQNDRGALALPVVIPDGYVWLMGDNRDNSQDSRWFGPQPVSRIVGKAFFIYWPISDFGTL